MKIYLILLVDVVKNAKIHNVVIKELGVVKQDAKQVVSMDAKLIANPTQKNVKTDVKITANITVNMVVKCAKIHVN